jgi:hypothetical protein
VRKSASKSIELDVNNVGSTIANNSRIHAHRDPARLSSHPAAQEHPCLRATCSLLFSATCPAGSLPSEVAPRVVRPPQAQSAADTPPQHGEAGPARPSGPGARVWRAPEGEVVYAVPGLQRRRRRRRMVWPG